MTISNIEQQIKILAAQLKKLKHVAPQDDRASSASISETHAAGLFFSLITDRVFEEWPTVISQLREINNGQHTEDIFDNIDEEGAKMELLLAAMALDLRTLKNLFPKEQAQRLYEHCIESIPQKVRDYARSTFEEYISRFDEDVKSGLNPLSAVGDIIYGRWGLGGDTYVPGEFFIAPRPVVALGLCQYALSYGGVWKQIRTNFIINGKTIDQNEKIEIKKKKASSLRWLLWWQIDQDELAKQVSSYHSLKVTQSIRGQSLLLLIFSACATTVFIAFFNSPIANFIGVFISLLLGYFIFRGHKWAMIGAMLFWSFEKFILFYDGFQLIHIIWWAIYMHAFYFSFEVEEARDKEAQAQIAVVKANILACTNCGAEFNPKDYRIDAQEWLCSSCLAPLPKK